jgi:hypothetical protein
MTEIRPPFLGTGVICTGRRRNLALLKSEGAELVIAHCIDASGTKWPIENKDIYAVVTVLPGGKTVLWPGTRHTLHNTKTGNCIGDYEIISADEVLPGAFRAWIEVPG